MDADVDGKRVLLCERPESKNEGRGGEGSAKGQRLGGAGGDVVASFGEEEGLWGKVSG